MAFTPRKTCPSTSEAYWKLSSAGGYNLCIMGSSSQSSTYSSALPNCTGYAYGRFMEAGGMTKCNLSRGNAGTWYLQTGDGYKRGKEPQVGAVICWSKIGGAGHVGVVEEVRPDGSILTSESGWGNAWSDRFWTKVRTNADGRWGASSSYVFQGFIYNPNVTGEVATVDASKAFVAEALKHVGEGATWTWLTYGQSNIEWCAAFVSAVSKSVGILNRCIYNTANAPGHAREGVKAKFGSFYKGPGQGGRHVPVPGDLIFFRNSVKDRPDQYSCDHVGIVVDVNKEAMQVSTVEGNTGTNNKHTSTVKKKDYSLTATNISGYFHPNWSLVGSIDPTSTVYVGELYSSATTRKDMTVREIGYLDSKYQPSIKSSDIKLSAINYTGLLAAVFKLVAPQSSVMPSTNGGTANTDKLTGNCKIVVDHLISKGLNAAAACGVAANIYHESSFNTAAVGDNGTSFGICQWHNERGAAMKKMAGSNWANNLTGQLEYLWYELSTDYNSNILSPLQNISNDNAGCMKAADIFVRRFERPSLVDMKSIQRQATAVSYFSQVVIVQAPPVTTDDNSTLRTQSGALANIVKTITIPGDVKQTGIIRNYTNYTHFFSKWARSSVQRKLADIWNQKGRKQKRNIATIDNYFLVAMAPVFGTTGDIVTIELANGYKIDAILGDAKGSDAKSYWGHAFGAQVDIVEWEAIGNGQKDPTKIDLGAWAGEKVIRVHNRGTYLR